MNVRDAVVALFDSLAPTDDKDAGAGLALLRAAHDANVVGLAAVAARWKAARMSRYVGSALTQWFEQTGSSVR